MHIEQWLRMLGLVRAGWVLWLLLGLSMIALAIIAERLFLFSSSRVSLVGIEQLVIERLKRGDHEAARRQLETMPSFEARILEAGLNARSAAGARAKMAKEVNAARVDLERGLGFLGTLGSSAPSIGLLGTVIGIIGVLRRMGLGLGSVSLGPMLEIGEALVATAFGLFVALPAIAAYNALQQVVRNRLRCADALGQELLSVLWPEYSTADPFGSRILPRRPD